MVPVGKKEKTGKKTATGALAGEIDALSGQDQNIRLDGLIRQLSKGFFSKRVGLIKINLSQFKNHRFRNVIK